MGKLRSADHADASQWCLIGELLQCWSIVDRDTARELFARGAVPAASVIAGLLHASRMDILESDEELFEAASDAILTGTWVGHNRGGSLLQRLARAFERMLLGNPHPRYAGVRRVSLLEYWNEVDGADEEASQPSYTAAACCARVLEEFTEAAKRPIGDWSTSIEPWTPVIHQGIEEFGERPVLFELANVAAGIRSREEKCPDSPDLFDARRPLVRRARYARLRAGSQRWWSSQLQSATSANEVQLALLVFATWAGGRTIEGLAEEFNRLVLSLGTSGWNRLHSSLRNAVEVNSSRSWIKRLTIRVSELPASLSVRTVALIAERCTPATRVELCERYLSDYKGDDPTVSALRADVEFRRALRDESRWSQAIESLRTSYSLGAPIGSTFFPYRRRHSILPEEVAREIVDNPLDFPAALVHLAETRCRQLDAARIVPVGRVATKEGWFAEQVTGDA